MSLVKYFKMNSNISDFTQRLKYNEISLIRIPEFEFKKPKRKINTSETLEKFHASKSFMEFTSFILLLNHSVCDIKSNAKLEFSEVSPSS